MAARAARHISSQSGAISASVNGSSGPPGNSLSPRASTIRSTASISVAAATRRALAADSGSPPHTTAIYSDLPVSSLWCGRTISYSPISSLRGRSVHGPSVCFNSLISHRPFSTGHTARCTSTPPASGSAGSRRPGSTWSGSWLVDLHGAVLILDRDAPDRTVGHVGAPEQQHHRRQDHGLDHHEAKEQ